MSKPFVLWLLRIDGPCGTIPKIVGQKSSERNAFPNKILKFVTPFIFLMPTVDFILTAAEARRSIKRRPDERISQ
jgi:hypothetical protein